VKQVSGKRLASLLTKKGWNLRRINGSHHIFGMSGRRERITVPVHGNKPLKSGLLRHLMKLAELEEDEL
jgi:predicted RNA binding protein YcfA (HicA-like mRNA interferase family)